MAEVALVLSSLALVLSGIAVHVAMTAAEDARRALLLRWHPALGTPPPEDHPDWTGR
jgi:heme/copper-type cytochrome/quinol oxidase subunit 3